MRIEHGVGRIWPNSLILETNPRISISKCELVYSEFSREASNFPDHPPRTGLVELSQPTIQHGWERTATLGACAATPSPVSPP